MIRSITLFSVLILLLQSVKALGQGTYQPMNTGAYQLLDRYEVLSGRIDPSIHSSLKPYNREYINRFVDSLLDLRQRRELGNEHRTLCRLGFP